MYPWRFVRFSTASSIHPPEGKETSIIVYKFYAWVLCSRTNTYVLLLIKILALTVVTILTHIKYITNHSIIIIIIIIIFWYFLLAPVANIWKQTHLERSVLVPIEEYHFYQMLTIIIASCRLLLYLKRSITISNWGSIWK